MQDTSEHNTCSVEICLNTLLCCMCMCNSSNNHIPYHVASGLAMVSVSCRVCGKPLLRSNQRRVLGGESSSSSSANATEFLKFVGSFI